MEQELFKIVNRERLCLKLPAREQNKTVNRTGSLLLTLKFIYVTIATETRLSA